MTYLWEPSLMKNMLVSFESLEVFLGFFFFFFVKSGYVKTFEMLNSQSLTH